MTPEDYLKTGVYKVDYETYDAIPAVRGGYLHRLDDVPAKAKVENEDDDTPTLIFGRAAHTLTLEKEKFESEFVVAQPCQVPMKSGKRKGEPCGNAARYILQDAQEWYCGAHWTGDDNLIDSTRAILSTREFADLCGISASIKAHPTATKLMQAGRPEVCIVWKDDKDKKLGDNIEIKATGLWCKALIDWLPDVRGVVLDLKTTRNANYFPFSRQVRQLGYDVAAAMRLEGLRAVFPEYDQKEEMPYLFCWIAVEKTEPWHVEVYEFDSEYYEWAATEFYRLLKIEKECREVNSWPAWKEAGSQIIVKPGWLDAY